MKEYIKSTDVELSPIERGEIHEFVASSIIFEEKYATFDITHDENCDITYDDTVDYKIGDTVVLQLITTPPNAIRSLLVNDVEMVELIDTDDMTLTLTVAQLSNVINVTAGVPATITVTDDASSHTTYEQKDYYIGDTVIFNLSFDEGYELNTVDFNDVDVTADVVDNTLTKVLIAAGNTLNVVPQPKVTATVTITDDPSSHTTYEQKQYYVGDTVIFNLSFDEGNELDTVTFNGDDVTAEVVDNTLTKVLIAGVNTLNVYSKTTGQ